MNGLKPQTMDKSRWRLNQKSDETVQYGWHGLYHLFWMNSMPHGCENGLHSWQNGQDIMGIKKIRKEEN